MATLKKQKSDGTWEYIQVVGSNTISTFDTHLADLAKHGTYTDTATNKKYQLGVLNGLIYYKEVI